MERVRAAGLLPEPASETASRESATRPRIRRLTVAAATWLRGVTGLATQPANREARRRAASPVRWPARAKDWLRRLRDTA